MAPKQRKATTPTLTFAEPSLHDRVRYHVDDMARELTLAHPMVQKRHAKIKSRLYKAALGSPEAGSTAGLTKMIADTTTSKKGLKEPMEKNYENPRKVKKSEMMPKKGKKMAKKAKKGMKKKEMM